MTDTTLPILEDFQLLLELSPEGESDAFVPVRWCLSPELRQGMTERNVTDAGLVLIVAANFGSEDYPQWLTTEKKLVKLTSEMAFVRFNRPGVNRVFAVIAWRDDEAEKRLSRYVFEDSQDVDGYSGDIQPSFLQRDYVHRFEFVAQRDVVVPREMFAPEPAAYQKALVRKFFRDPEADQCHFRKHFLWSLLWVLPYLITTVLIRAFYALFAGVLFGLRDIKWAALWHPFRDDAQDMWVNVQLGNFWWTVDRNYQGRHWYWIFFQPVSYIVFTAFLLIRFPTALAVGFAVLAHAALFGLMAVVGTLYVKAKSGTQRPEKRRKAQERRESKFQASLDVMVCNTATDKRVSIDALPANKRTLALRFNGLKKGVCRPFAK